MNNLKIIMVDDHALFRLGIRSVILDKLPHTSILAEYSSGEELLQQLTESNKPNIILLDIVMPGISGIETARQIKKKYSDIKIIMLSSEMALEVINELLDIGVDGYLSKFVLKEDLAEAIISVADGGIYYGQDIAHIMYNAYISRRSKKSRQKVSITEREREVIELFCEGITVKEIADRLNISKRTIDTHKANIMQKLGFHSTVELVKYAIREGIITL